MNAQAGSERVTVFTPLGIRFWDFVRDDMIGDQLVVTARPAAAGAPVISAFVTGNSVYAFRSLPGLHALEYPSTPETPIPPRRFIIEVRDLAGRFLPMAFGVDLPLPYRGVFPTATGSPPSSPAALPGVYLFSAPTRSAEVWAAAVRGQLADSATGRPAAHAVIEVRVEGQTWTGISDPRGAIAVLFPYPPFSGGRRTSPPGSSGVTIGLQHWSAELRVRWAPEWLTYPAGSELPDLRSVLTQPYAAFWPDNHKSPGSPVLSSITEIFFAREFVLRSQASSELLLSVEGSPPSA